MKAPPANSTPAAEMRANPVATKPESTTFQTELPVRLLAEMQSLVDAGWFRSLDEVIHDALRRFLDSHREDLMQGLLREDVEWASAGRIEPSRKSPVAPALVNQHTLADKRRECQRRVADVLKKDLTEGFREYAT